MLSTPLTEFAGSPPSTALYLALSELLDSYCTMDSLSSNLPGNGEKYYLPMDNDPLLLTGSMTPLVKSRSSDLSMALSHCTTGSSNWSPLGTPFSHSTEQTPQAPKRVTLSKDCIDMTPIGLDLALGTPYDL